LKMCFLSLLRRFMIPTFPPAVVRPTLSIDVSRNLLPFMCFVHRFFGMICPTPFPSTTIFWAALPSFLCAVMQLTLPIILLVIPSLFSVVWASTCTEEVYDLGLLSSLGFCLHKTPRLDPPFVLALCAYYFYDIAVYGVSSVCPPPFRMYSR